MCYDQPVKIDFHDALQRLLADHPEYRADAYRFLYMATSPSSFAAQQEPDTPCPKHLTAKEFYNALCRLAQHEFGPMAYRVLSYWGLKTTEDIANATYYLIEVGLFSKQRHESKEDFSSLPNLKEALEKTYIPRS